MPTRAQRRCTTSGCPGTAVSRDSGKCGECRSAPRPSATAQGYGVEHRDVFREGVLERDPMCVLCGRRPARVADHHPLSRKELVAAGLDPNDPQYGRGLCRRCDSTQTAERQPGGWNRDRARTVTDQG